MLKNKKKAILAILITTISVCSVVLVACQSKGKPIQLPSEDEIVKLQIHAFRFEKGESFKDRVKSMKEGVEKTEPLSKQEAKKHPMGEETYSLGFFYKDGKKDFFKCYKDGEEWFMKTKDGDVYANADFIAEHVEPEESTGVVESDELPKEPIQFDFRISQELYEYGEKTDFDLRFLLAKGMTNHEKMTDEALSEEVYGLKCKLFLYQYAMENGCKITEEELDKGYAYSYVLLTEELVQEYEKQLTEALQKAGVLREVYDKGVKASDKLTFAVVKLDEKKRQEFMDGTDHIEGVEYVSAGDYAQKSRNHLMQDALETDKHKELMDKVTKEVEDAKQAYLKEFGDDAS